MPIITPAIDMDFGAGWVDVSEDVVSRVTAEWGVHGSTPTDRVADTGVMTFDLDNSAANSGSVRGYYSPDHASVRSGFAIGIPVRLKLTTPLLGTKVKWVGTIEDIRAVPGAKRPTTRVRCVDWMEEAARAKLAGIAVQTDVQSDDLFDTLVAAVDRQPPGGTRVGSGSDIYEFALDNVQDEGGRVAGELQKLALSEYGFIFVQAGELVFEGRRRRGGGGNVRYALDEDEQIISLGVSQGRDDISNRVQVSVHPRRRDAAATTVLFTLGGAIEIPRNTSVTINCPYSDPDQKAQRVGGVDMVTPVPTTDYQFNTEEDGTGVDITAQIAITPTFGGNTASLLIENNGPSDGWIPAGGLQLRGRGLYDFEPVISDRKDQTSIDSFGECIFGYDMPHQSRPQNALDLALFLLDQYKDPTTRVETVTFIANWDDEATENAFNLEISEQVSIESPTLGLSAQPYFVNGQKLEIEQSGLVRVTWDLGPVDLSQYWILDVAGRTELDQTTVLGYGLFVAGWKLDESELGTNTFLN